MSNKIVGHGVRAEARGLSGKIEELSQHVMRMLFGINQRFMGSDQRLNALEERVNALVHLTGEADVNAYVENSRVERARAASAQEKAALESNLKERVLVVADEVGEKSLVVGRYVLKDGKVQEPGRTQLAMPNVQDPHRAALLGKKVGFVLDIGNDNKFELMEIYNVDEERARVVLAERQKAAVEATAQEAQAQAVKDEQADQQVDAEVE